jgi:hypothetical protein
VLLSWDDLHGGTVAWLHYKMNWLPVYATLAEMPPEEAQVFLFLCREDAQPRSDGALNIEAIMAIQIGVMQRLGMA